MTLPSVSLGVSNTDLCSQLYSVNDYWFRDDVMGFMHQLRLHISHCGDKTFSDRAFWIKTALRLLSTQVQSQEECREIVTYFCLSWTSPCFDYFDILDKRIGEETCEGDKYEISEKHFSSCVYYGYWEIDQKYSKESRIAKIFCIMCANASFTPVVISKKMYCNLKFSLIFMYILTFLC